jgi:hypothetical protein
VSGLYAIRADYDRDSIVVYQAYGARIADEALRNQRFVAPFSFNRMTWIKPSFLWLMHRSNWGRKRGQERTLAVRIRRAGWEQALAAAVLTHPEPSIHPSPGEWSRAFNAATVHVQWDTERALRGGALEHYSIQVGISRHLIRTFVDEWILQITDLTPTVTKIRTALKSGKHKGIKRLLPPERPYPMADAVAARIAPR